MKKINKIMLFFSTILLSVLIIGCKKPDEVRYTITEEEWLKYASEENFTLVRDYNLQDGKDKNVSKYTIEAIDLDGSIIVLEGEIQYQLSETDEGWVAHDVTVLDFWHGGLLENLNLADYTYNEEKKVYQTAKFTDGSWSEIYFINGVPIKIVDFGKDSEEETFIEYTTEIINIGTTEIDVPEYTIYVPPTVRYTVTLEEWNSYKDQYNYDLMFFSNEFESRVGEQKSIQGAHVINGKYYVEIDGKVYSLVETEEGWNAVAVEKFLGFRGPVLQGVEYDEVEFNSEESMYISKNPNSQGFKYYFIFGDGKLELVGIEDVNNAPGNIEYYFFNSIGDVELDIPEYTIK